MLCCSYASMHVVEVQDHGWSAAVPTTILIAALPYIEERAEQPGEMALLVGIQKNSFDLLLDDLVRRCDADELLDLQWELLVDQILRQNADQIKKSFQSEAYVKLLQWCEIAGALDTNDIARLDASSHVDFSVADAWPLGQGIYGKVSARHWASYMPDAYTVSDRESGDVLMDVKPFVGMMGSRLFFPWEDRYTYLGPASPGKSAIKLTISMTLPRFGRVPERQRQYDVDIPISVGGVAEDYVKMVPSQRIADALQERRGSCLVLRSIGEDVALQFDPSPLNTVLIEEGIDVLALRFEILDGETVLSTGRAWWSTEPDTAQLDVGRPGIRDTAYVDIRVPMDPIDCSFRESYDDENKRPEGSAPTWLHVSRTGTAIPMQQPNGVRRFPSDLILRVTSDPALAVRRADAPTCWEGAVDLPLRTTAWVPYGYR